MASFRRLLGPGWDANFQQATVVLDLDKLVRFQTESKCGSLVGTRVLRRWLTYKETAYEYQLASVP